MTDNQEEDLLAQDVHNRPHQPPLPQQYYSNQQPTKVTVPAKPGQQIDLSAILKQMSQEQISQLLADPEVAKILQNQNSERRSISQEFNLRTESDH